MFAVKVSQKDLSSHLYLNDLVGQQGLQDFALVDGHILSANTLSEDSVVSSHQGSFEVSPEYQKLIIFGEGLHLQQVLAVRDQLAEYLSIHFFRVVQSKKVQGFAVCAYVVPIIQDAIKTHLEAVACSLSVELCLIDKVPALNEPGLLLMDMDSTVIAVECIDEIAALAGVGEQVSAVTAQAMQGKLDFAESLRTRVACLTDANENILQQVRDALPLMPGVANLITILKSYNWKVAIASGGFTYFADYLRDRLELDAAVANELEIKAAKLTGKVQGGIIDAHVKAQTLKSLAQQWGIQAHQTIAMGDGANDLVMMDAAALGVALHAKPIVREQADIAIRRGGLDTLVWILEAGTTH